MSAPARRLVAALDLGSTRVTALIGELTGDARDPGVRVLGVGTERTTGLRRGVVRDIEEATRAIQKALQDAERMAGVEVGTVYCGIAGEHVAGRTSHGMVSVAGDEIRTGDVARVNDMAASISFGRDHELLHAVPLDYLVDQQAGIADPIGMAGTRLEVEAYLVTVLSSVLANLRKCVEKAGYHVAEFCLEPLAASLAVLHPDERELGCMLVELGGASTNVAIFLGGKIRHTASLRAAGGHVTADLVAGLQVTQQDAERLKERHGAAYEALVPEGETVELPGPPGQGARRAERRLVAHIMRARLQEVLEFAGDELKRAGFDRRLPGGVVLTGGGALTPGIVELAREVLAMSTRVGAPGERLSGLVDSVGSARFAVTAGLALYGARQEFQNGFAGSGTRRGGGAKWVDPIVGPVKRWLQDFF